MKKERAPRNRTLTVTDAERKLYKTKLIYPKHQLSLDEITNKTICSDLFSIIDQLPSSCVDLLVIDPPYNLDKKFHGMKFSKSNDESYLAYLKSWFPKIIKVLKPNGSVYLCGDWKSTFCLYQVMKENTEVRSRITWQREKWPSANANWLRHRRHQAASPP